MQCCVYNSHFTSSYVCVDKKNSTLFYIYIYIRIYNFRLPTEAHPSAGKELSAIPAMVTAMAGSSQTHFPF